MYLYFKAIKLLSILLGVILMSCNNDEIDGPPSDFKDVSLCYHDSIWDQTKIRNSLLGIWQWEYISCGRSDGGAFVIDSNVTVKFRPDSLLFVKQFNDTTQTAQWEIVSKGIDGFSVSEEPSIDYLTGRIRICEDKVIFDAQYFDACANYFRKH